ncbi:MAG: DUF86 domain-containing protein [Desulfovermiculus sp.]
MSPGRVSQRIVADRISWVQTMLADIQSLPLESFEQFTQERRTMWAAESCMRRALEAMLDLGRHVAAKGLGKGVSEYKEIASHLAQAGILSAETAQLMKQMAGYRNRLVHFYHEVSTEELYTLCANNLEDIRAVIQEITDWLNSHPQIMDSEL